MLTRPQQPMARPCRSRIPCETARAVVRCRRPSACEAPRKRFA